MAIMAQTLLFLLLCMPSLCFAEHQARHIDYYRGQPPNPLWRRSASRNVPDAGYYVPANNGGAMLTSIPVTYPAGLGEPINGIISGHSDDAVLVDSELKGGLRNYFVSLGFGSECLGQHSGSDQAANLGDGNGYKNETAVIRWDYGDPALGTCQETIQGGNHFRYWVQNGDSGNSGAIFMAISYELPIALGHDIVTNGYNLARDYIVGNISGQAIPTADLTNASTYTGTTSYANYTYETSIAYTSGLLSNTSQGINHYATVGLNGLNAVDGLVAVFTVKITSKPAGSSATSLHQNPMLAILAALCVIILPLHL